MAGSDEFKRAYQHAGQDFNFQPGGGPVAPSKPAAGLPQIIDDEDNLSFPAPAGGITAGDPINGSTADYLPGDTEPLIRRNLKRKDRGKTPLYVGNKEARIFGYYDQNRDYLYDDGKITYDAQGDKRIKKGVKKFGKQTGIKFKGVKKNAEIAFNPDYAFDNPNVRGEAMPHFFKGLDLNDAPMKHIRKHGIEPDKGQAMHTISMAPYDSDIFAPFEGMNAKKGRKQFYHGVLGHEIGHALGLAHPTQLHARKGEADSLMSYGPDNQYSPKFSKSDLAMLNAIYN